MLGFSLLGRAGYGPGKAAGSGTSPALAISGTPVTSATEGVAYAGFTVSASGGTSPYAYSLVGTWPAGISIDSSTGAVSGTPTEDGSFTGLSVRVTDDVGATADLTGFTLAVAAVSAHRYWGVNVTAVDGGSRVAIAELLMRETEWGPNVATGGTASASDATFGAASNAFDGDNATAWRSNSTSARIAYDFGVGNAKAITQVVIRPYATAPTESPKDFTVQYSDDGSSWTTSFTITGETGWRLFTGTTTVNPVGQARAFNSSGRQLPVGATRYWAIRFADTGSGALVRVVEANFRETASGSNIAGGTASATGTSNSTTPASARDGNTGTWWDSNTSFPVAFFMDWGAGNNKSIVEVVMQATTSAWPKNFGFYKSHDNYVFEEVWTPAAQAAWSALEIRTFTKP